jgi:hypothetical protein
VTRAAAERLGVHGGVMVWGTMGKIDDMRRLREASYTGDAEPTPKRSPRAAPNGAAADEQGRCSGCGKTRAVERGLIASHQKGLGKACPGSRKAPA